MLLSTGLTSRGTGMGNMSVSWGTVKTMVRVMPPDNAPSMFSEYSNEWNKSLCLASPSHHLLPYHASAY